MIRLLLRYLRGYVRIRASGSSTERFLNMCSFHQIYVWGLCPVDGDYEMYVDLPGFRKIRPIARKTGMKIRIRKRYGFGFFLHRFRKKKGALAGFLLCLVILKTCSLFIWDIHFEGNQRRTNEALLAFLKTCDVAPFMRRSSVDCGEIVRAVREEYEDIVWVSASLEGNLLRIRIKENEDTMIQERSGEESETDPSQEQKIENEDTVEDGDAYDPEEACDLVAARDGQITEIVTRSGVPLVHEGDQVKEGDILVRGRIDILDDSGGVTGYRYVKADADISGDTREEYLDSIPLLVSEKKYTGRVRYQPYIRIFDWKISLGTLRNHFEHSDTVTEEFRLRTGESGYLPFRPGLGRAREYTLEERNLTQEEIRRELTGRFTLFCSELEEKGIQIRGNSVRIHLGDKTASASGILYLNQEITREAPTEILTVERNEEQDESVGTDD